MNMKRVYALMLTALLLFVAVNTVFAQNYDATFTLTGYEIGKKITEIGVEIDNPFYELYPVISFDDNQVNAIIGTNFSTSPTPLLDGVFEEGKEYFIDIYFVCRNHDQFTIEELESFLNEAELRLFDGSAPFYKNLTSSNAENAEFEVMFHLPVLHTPVQEAELPKTGDESNVVLWSALACISLFGMMTFVRKRKEV